MISTDQFLRILNTEIKEETEATFALGSINSGHSSGRPRIMFDSSPDLSVKSYPYLSSYTPVANDRVLLARVGHTWVVLGKVL